MVRRLASNCSALVASVPAAYVPGRPVPEPPNAVAAAAQTLGLRTLEPQQLKELVEGKFVDALRTAAGATAAPAMPCRCSASATKPLRFMSST